MTHLVVFYVVALGHVHCIFGEQSDLLKAIDQVQLIQVK